MASLALKRITKEVSNVNDKEYMQHTTYSKEFKTFLTSITIIIHSNQVQSSLIQIDHSSNNLIIKIKPQPKSLLLKDLTIAIDAGHGGTNTGAVGPTGVAEKEITLPINVTPRSDANR
jgi:N-acetylmuramoyl-L-alanine amidase